MNRKNASIAILLVLAFLVGSFFALYQVSTLSNDYYNRKTELKQLEDELENLDKMLGVYIAAPREIDKDESINVVVCGVRLGKAVLVEPKRIEISLEDQYAFKMASRSYSASSSDKGQYVVNLYDKLYITEFSPIESSGIFTIRVEMTYTAPWGEDISGSATQEISVQDWFNITSILEASKLETQELLQTTMGGAADFIRELAEGARFIAAGVEQIIIWLGKMQEVGDLDPSDLTFLPVFLDGFRLPDDMEPSGLYDRKDPGGVNVINPQANFQAFIDSLQVVVDTGLPIEVYTIRTFDHLRAFGYGDNNTSANPAEYTLTDENPLDTNYLLSYDPTDPSHTWVPGLGRPKGVSPIKSLDLRAPIPFRNILVNMYENWFPIPSTGWYDYKTGSDTPDLILPDGGVTCNGTRWLKHLVIGGMMRNFSLLYNIRGEPFQNFFSDNIGVLPDIVDFRGFETFNDFATLEINMTLGNETIPFDPNTRKDVGGYIEYREAWPDTTIQAHLTTGWYDVAGVRMDGDGIWVGTFFNGTTYDTYEPVFKSSFLIHDSDIYLNAYHASALDCAAVGMKLSPSCGFGYSSLENTTVGFEMLHGLYYKDVQNSVKLSRQKIADSVASFESQIASSNETDEIDKLTEMVDSLNQYSSEIYDAWYGTEANDYEDRLDIQSLTGLYTGMQEDLLSDWAVYSLGSINATGEKIYNITSEQFENSVTLDSSLDIAGSDLSFDILGDIVKTVTGGGGGGGGSQGTSWLTGSSSGIINAALSWLGGSGGGVVNSYFSTIGGAGGVMIPFTKVDIIGWAKDVAQDVVKWMLGSLIDTLESNFALIDDLWEQVLYLRDQVVNAIQQVLELVVDLFLATADALDAIADTIDDLVDFINAFVEISYNALIEQANSLQAQLADLKTEVLQSTGFYFKIRDSMYKMLERSEFASGLLRYASEEFGDITEEIFFKEVDVLQPLALMQSGDSGLYVVQMGTEVLDEIYYVTIYRGQLVNVDDINATYQVMETSPIKMSVSQAYDSRHGFVDGVYVADFALATERDWMTKADIKYTDTDSEEEIYAFIVERTTKREPSLQPDAYPEIIFDPDDVDLNTGEDYVLHIGIDNLMYSEPDVTCRAELISSVGTLVGLREQMLELNPEGSDPVFIDLEASLPFYLPPGEYQLIVKVVEDNGDVTRVVHDVEVTSDNFFFSLIGALLTFMGIGVIAIRYRSVRKQKKSMDAISGREKGTLPQCSLEDFKAGKCVPKCDPNDIDCRI